MSKEIKEAIAILEKILKPLDASKPQCKLNLNPEKIRKALTLLKQQPTAGEFTKEARQTAKNVYSSNPKLWPSKDCLSSYINEACDRLDAETEIALKSLEACTLANMENIKIRNRLDRAEAENKELRDSVKNPPPQADT